MAGLRQNLRKFVILALIAGLFVFPISLASRAQAYAVQFRGYGNQAQQITFEPSIAPAEFATGIPPIFLTMTVEAIPVTFETEGYFSPTIESVDCGPIADDVCYLICYTGTCFTLGNDDDRVERYKDLVEDRENLIKAYENAKRDMIPGFLRVIGNCLKAAGVGVIAYGAIMVGAAYAAASPEPLTKTIAGVLTGLGIAAICGASIFQDLVFVFQDTTRAANDVKDITREAVVQFRRIQEGR